MLRIRRAGALIGLAAIAIATSGCDRFATTAGHMADGRMSAGSFQFGIEVIPRFFRDQFRQRYRERNRERPRNGVFTVMKLGLGIPYCRGHRATLAVRRGKYFRPVAIAQTVRGARGRHAGLLSAWLTPGTYHVVHATCRAKGRSYHVGNRRAKRYATAFASFSVRRGRVNDAGFLRFSPRRNGRLPVRLDRIPRADWAYLRNRGIRPRQPVTVRLMSLVPARDRDLTRLGRPAPRARPTPRRRPAARKRPRPTTTKPKRRVVTRRRPTKPTVRPRVINRAPKKPVERPLIRTPKPTPTVVRPRKPKPARRVTPPRRITVTRPPPPRPSDERPTPPTFVPPDAFEQLQQLQDRSQNPAITSDQRKAACEALEKLKREGKVQTVPKLCEEVLDANPLVPIVPVQPLPKATNAN